MTSPHAKATAPDEIPELFREFVRAGDFEGLASLYENDAVLALPPGEQTAGNAAIAGVFKERFAGQPLSSGDGAVKTVLVSDDLALTSTRFADGRVTAEIARRQPDGSWRWVVDNPNL